MSVNEDWRFAELIVRAWTEPGLRRRYEENPHQVLAEAGIPTVPGEAVPALPVVEELDVVVDLFDLLPAEAPATAMCLSINDTEPTAVLAGAEALTI
ncbi:hypothetical protein [Kitasatospora sp. GP82]|uniref:hypothetical protein n=1 Tax=Kitasatospora sp. GP82 TaxID=3035089 RepID=UPI0024749133|nr:hypothetical protein [Kitasatospora sp. GP82]MDH6128046.1 hypothetical protein [Kitasatospora sp. GP82]